MSQNAPRPGQATFAAWLIIGGSVILVITAWQRISSLNSLEVQEELRRVLSEPPVEGMGISFETLKTTIRVLSMVAAGAATASAILGYQALQRSTSARLALTLLAPLVLVGGFATAGFFAPMVVAGIAMLWLHPTRDWFAGRQWTATRVPGRQDPFARPDSRGGTQPSTWPVSPSEKPRPEPETAPTEPKSGEPERPASQQPGPYDSPYGAPPQSAGPLSPYAAPPRRLPRRPPALVWACSIVWITCSGVAGVMLLLSVLMAVARDELFAELERQQPDNDLGGLSHAEIATGVYLTTVVVVAWCAVAVALAVLAFRGVGWARIGLAVCSATAAAVTLAAAFLSPVLVVLVAAAAATLWLMLRADVAAWFKR